MSRFGIIGQQYFDDAGDPLVSGKLYFYESGTTTDKTTYADVNLSIPNTNPVVLTAVGRQPNIFFTGSARVILTSSDDVQVEVRDPVGGDAADSAFESWNSETTYNTGDIRTGSDGNYYKSIIDANQGNDPTTDPTAWTRVKFISVWNTNETYNITDVVQGSDGLIYSSLINMNSGNDPTTASAGNWVNTSGGVTGVGLDSSTLHFLVNS